MNICFETFGCRLNRAEALEDESRAIAEGYKVVTSHSEADVIVIRGCSVTGRAEHDCQKLIEHLKKHYPTKRLVVTGCYKDQSGKLELKASDSVPTRTARAYLKVQDGCNSACTFCIVPKFRGKSVSVPFAEVIKKAQAFIAAGYKELVVTGCNLIQYADEGKSLVDLVAVLCELDSGVRVRLGSVEPGALAMKLVDLMVAKPNLCRYLHLSIQSGSERILHDMRRPYTEKDVKELLEHAAAVLPKMAFGCDLIAGYPGETLIDHELSKSLFRRFKNLVHGHIFPYSERPGTVAGVMLTQVPKDERRHRAHELSAMAEKNVENFRNRFFGEEVEVVIETSDEHTPAGWTSEYVWCKFPGLKGRKGLRKSIVKGRVIKVTEHGFRAH